MTVTTNFAHLDMAEKNEDLPDVGAAKRCCDNPKREMGYGMAGGGMGVYEYCDNCGKVVSKTEDQDVR